MKRTLLALFLLISSEHIIHPAAMERYKLLTFPGSAESEEIFVPLSNEKT